MTAINTQRLRQLAAEWERIARRKFIDSEAEDSEYGRRFIAHGAWCYFNCAQQIRKALCDDVPLPLATRSKRQTLLQQLD